MSMRHFFSLVRLQLIWLCVHNPLQIFVKVTEQDMVLTLEKK